MSDIQGYFEATVDFEDRGFKLPDTLIGKVLPFKFKKQHYQIHFPNFDLTSDPKPFRSHFKVTRKHTKIGLNWIEANSKDASKYGSASRNNGTLVIDFSASSLIVRSNKPITPSAARKAKQDLLLWRDLLPTWVEVLDYRDLESSSVDVEQESSIDAYFISSAGKTKVRRVKKRNENGANIRLMQVHAINPKVFRKALRSTEAGDYPPSYYTMLIKGLKHYNAKSYRQSLFDTATAVEMAMTELLDRKLTIINPQQKKNLMKESQQLSGLARALRTTGETVSPDIQSKVGAPRNKAIHQGLETNELQAREALATAKNFIKIKLPL